MRLGRSRESVRGRWIAGRRPPRRRRVVAARRRVATGTETGKKKKDKTREVWISFAGRIVAQVIGALASVILGVYIVRRIPEAGADAG